MPNFLVYELLPLFLSSVIVLIVSYFKIPSQIQQASSLILIALVFRFFSQVSNAKTEQDKKRLLFLTIFTSSLFVQLLINSTGSFFSSFLILFHLFAITLGLIFSFRTTLTFLIFALATQVISIRLNGDLSQLLHEDPNSLILYGISFLVIVPLIQIISKSYHLKELALKKMTEFSQLTLSREQSIVQGLNEIVAVTDNQLNILSLNEAAEKMLKLDAEKVLNQNLLTVLTIKDIKGEPATTKTLNISDMLVDKTTRFVDNFSLDMAALGKPMKLSIQIRPVVDASQKVTQIVFVLKDASLLIEQPHRDLEETKKKQVFLLDSFKKILLSSDISRHLPNFELLYRNYEDIGIAQELEDHPISKQTGFEDVALVCNNLVNGQQDFAKSLNSSLEFVLPPEEKSESSLIALSGNAQVGSLVSDFAIPINSKWIKILVSKLLDISILLASSGKNISKIKVSVEKLELKFIKINISAPVSNPGDFSETDLFTQYFGKLTTTTNLKYASGQEGFIAKTIADQLKIPLKAEFNKYNGMMDISILLSRTIS